MSWLITGGCGFVGTNLADALLATASPSRCWTISAAAAPAENLALASRAARLAIGQCRGRRARCRRGGCRRARSSPAVRRPSGRPSGDDHEPGQSAARFRNQRPGDIQLVGSDSRRLAPTRQCSIPRPTKFTAAWKRCGTTNRRRAIFSPDSSRRLGRIAAARTAARRTVARSFAPINIAATITACTG